MWSEPVTLGGGITIVKGSASGRSGRNAPELSQCGYQRASMAAGLKVLSSWLVSSVMMPPLLAAPVRRGKPFSRPRLAARSEEHTSELQSLMRISYAGFCLKKKNRQQTTTTEFLNNPIQKDKNYITTSQTESI